MSIDNKLLHRQLKTAILELKYYSLQSLLKNFQQFTDVQSSCQYYKKGLKCSQCILNYEEFSASGFGRTNEEARSNAIKSLFDSIIERTHKIQELKESLKLINKHQRNDTTLDMSYIALLQSRCIPSQQVPDLTQLGGQTIDLQLEDSYIDLSTYNFRKEPELKYNFDFKNQKKKEVQTQQKSYIKSQKSIKTHKGQQNEDSCCVHYQLHLQAEKKILHLETRLQLLQQQNSLLKQCLLKDYPDKENRNFANCLQNIKL